MIGPAFERVWANASLPCGVFSSGRTGCIPEVPASERAAHRLTAPQDLSRLNWDRHCADTGGGSGRTEVTAWFTNAGSGVTIGA